MRTLVRALLVLAVLSLTFLFNIGLVEIRLDEISYLLGKVAADQDASRALGIVAKYELIKRRMERGEEHVENYELEARVQALTSGAQFTGEAEEKRRTHLVPVRLVLNAIRLILGKNLINTEGENRILKVLEIGYFWERRRKYPEAIKIYDEVLGANEVSPEIRSAVLMHKAFCHSMMSEYDNSKQIYERVIHNYPSTEAGILSWRLLDFIETMERKREIVKGRDLSNFEKAKQYYLLMDYRNAVKFFSIFLQDDKSSALAVQARYFKGRSHEELGESEEAVAEYRSVVGKGGRGKWAKESSRRMLMLGQFYEHRNQMAEEARKQLAAYQDDAFMNRMDAFKDMVVESSLRKELLAEIAESKKPKRSERDEEIMALINSIGELDLTGEKQRQREIKDFRRELIERGVSEERIQELERKREVAQNPFRRPISLKRVIDGNASQLRYLYNKRLRAGVKLSGKMVVEMHIEPDGHISSARVVRSDMGDLKFERDIVGQIRKWRFRAVPDTLGDLTIKYPFEFYEEKE